MTPHRKRASVFTIGRQQARTINNVAGDQTIVTSVGSSITIEQARREVGQLRRHLDLSSLSSSAAQQTEREIRAIESQLDSPRPHPATIAASLRRLTEVVKSAGALAAAGTALARPIESLARWLGAAGVPVLALLGLI
jgi:hypothetical protein